MKILFTLTGPWGTGAATVVEGVTQELLSLGHSVKVVFPDLGFPSPDKDKYYGNPDLYQIIKFPIRFRGLSFPTFPLILPDPNPRNVENAWTFKEMEEEKFAAYIDFLRYCLKKIISDFNPDIIETEHVWIMGYVLLELGYPVVVGAHNSDQMGYRYDKRMRPYAKACARGARYIFAISDHVKEKCLKLYEVPSDHVIVIPSGYDDSIFHPRRLLKERILKKYGMDAAFSLPVVTFGGKMSKTKGVDVLLKSNRMLQKRHPYLLLLFGSGDIKDALGRAPFEDELKNTYFMGHVTQDVLSDFFNIADFSVSPSREEGFCVAALEAMGCGLPIVGTDIPSLKELIVGKIVPPGNPAALAVAMESLLRLPPEQKERLRETSIKRALGYSWRKNSAKRMVYYEAVVNALSL
jgi:glycosyltransferase involved in cell wall biosynthesis